MERGVFWHEHFLKKTVILLPQYSCPERWKAPHHISIKKGLKTLVGVRGQAKTEKAERNGVRHEERMKEHTKKTKRTGSEGSQEPCPRDLLKHVLQAYRFLHVPFSHSPVKVIALGLFHHCCEQEVWCSVYESSWLISALLLLCSKRDLWICKSR